MAKIKLLTILIFLISLLTFASVVKAGEEGLILYLPFEGTSQNKITNQFGAEKNIIYLEGKEGRGAHIREASNVIFPAKGNINLKQGTIEFWFSPGWNGDDEGYHYLFAGNISDTRNINSIHISKKTYAGGVILGQIDGPAGSDANVVQEANVPKGVDFSPVSVANWRKGEWHHIAFTWNAKQKTIKIYFDGLIRATNPNVEDSAFPSDYENQIIIGSSVDETVFAEGIIDELKIWNYPRSDFEVAKSAGLTEINGYRRSPEASKSNLQIYLLIILIFIILAVFAFKVIRTKGAFKHVK